MAELQIISTTDSSHNYNDKTVIGHKDRTKDSDVNDWYTHSVFTQDSDTNNADGTEGQGDTGE